MESLKLIHLQQNLVVRQLDTEKEFQERNQFGMDAVKIPE